MKEDHIEIIGGEKIIMEKITYKEFRKIHPYKSKWLTFFAPGEGYFRFEKEGTLNARIRQISDLWNRDMQFREDRFIRGFSGLALYIYNQILTWPEKKQKEIPFSQWKRAINRALDNGMTEFERHKIEKTNIEKTFRNEGRKIISYWKSKTENLLYVWLSYVVKGDITLQRCNAPDCDRIFIPSQKDNIWCTERCRNMVNQKKYRQRKKKEREAINT